MLFYTVPIVIYKIFQVKLDNVSECLKWFITASENQVPITAYSENQVPPVPRGQSSKGVAVSCFSF